MSIINNRDVEQAQLAQAMTMSKRDLTAFTLVYETFVERIFAYCRHRVGSSQDAEDLSSQVFARAIAKRKTYRGGSVGAWLFRIAYHITIDYFRAKKPTLVSDDVLHNLHDDRQPSPLEMVIHKERLQLLQTWLDDLPDEKRNLLLLRITGDLTSGEIGEIVGKSASAVRVEIHRIIQHLKQQATLVGHRGTGKIASSRASVKERDRHLVKKSSEINQEVT